MREREKTEGCQILVLAEIVRSFRVNRNERKGKEVEGRTTGRAFDFQLVWVGLVVMARETVRESTECLAIVKNPEMAMCCQACK